MSSVLTTVWNRCDSPHLVRSASWELSEFIPLFRAASKPVGSGCCRDLVSSAKLNTLRRQCARGPCPEGQTREPILPVRGRWRMSGVCPALSLYSLREKADQRVILTMGLRPPKSRGTSSRCRPGVGGGPIPGNEVPVFTGTTRKRRLPREWGSGPQHSDFEATTGGLLWLRSVPAPPPRNDRLWPFSAASVILDSQARAGSRVSSI